MLARLIINLAIKAVLLLLFNYIGWLRLLNNGQPVTGWSWNAFFGAVLVSVVFVVVRYLVVWVWAIFTVLTLGLGVLLVLALPFLGYFLLWIVSNLMPDMLAIGGFWITTLCGFLLLIIGISAPSSNSSQTRA